ncbi:MAG: DUF2723 domain-containing protein [Flavobacteriales bacterium]|nr:MAG: DUF2723 domain-containing protein [Flavobacteriales bacterium]
MNYKKLNIITGWLVFLIATWTYVSTIERTASFWDCGEFLATANKLEVGHPPGAPLFMMIGRVASAFVSPEKVPVAINTLSALCSSLTILFLFWTITHMAHKLVTRNEKELSTGGIIAILGSGIVGALAYTWSDTFWFSAVEAEVYSMSSLFTAVTFWAILKWENVAHEAHSTRWLILICYLLGLGIGVQLLALLCIPPIAMVYYFKRYETTPRGIITALVISAIILGTIQSIIIPGVAKVAGKFELLFVNDMGLPFNSGNLFYFLLLAGLIVAGLRWTQRTGRVVANTVILGITVILVGYSTYAMTVIRSLANPPIDENNPENVFNLVSYLNREQYGDRPLLIGQFWDSPYSNERKDGTPVYSAVYRIEKDGRLVKNEYDGWSAKHFVEENPGHTIEHAYVITDPRKGTEVVYEPEFTMLFPRMYSSQRSHVDAYKEWCDFKGRPMRSTDREGKPTVIHKPTFGENLSFFTNYQVNWMYWRYFLWNFAGRQNDIQGHGNIVDGNWLSGVDMIDEQRLGAQDQLPASMTQNKGYNRFYLLPLLLGMIGMVFQLARHPKDWSITMLLFFFTGIAIVIYLNQYPYQPRERDYAYVGSFYAFAIWIGLGVLALYDAARTVTQKELGMVVGTAFGLGVLKYLVEWDGDHAMSYAILYMAVLGGAALGMFHLLGKVLKNGAVQATLATALGLIIPAVMVADGWDDHDRSTRMPARDLASDYLESCAPNAILFTNGDNDTFPLWYAQEVEGIRTDVRVVNLSLLNTDWYADQMRRRAYESDPVPIMMDPGKYRQGTRDVVALIPQGKTYRDLKEMMAFVTNDRNMQVLFQRGVKDAWFPTDMFSVAADSAAVFGSGTLQPGDTTWVPRVNWKIERQVLMKNHLLVLDMLANNNWQRPIYFAVTTGPDSYINLQDHFQLEGLTYRLVPAYSPNRNPNMNGRVATDIMYHNVMDKFKWGNMDTEGEIYLDENILRMTTNLRLQLSSLAEALIEEGRMAEAENVLDLSLAKMPERNVPYDRILLPTVEAYYALKKNEKANALTERLFSVMEENMAYYLSLDARFAEKLQQELSITHAVMGRLTMSATAADSTFGQGLQQRFEAVEEQYQGKLMEMRSGRKAGGRMRF